MKQFFILLISILSLTLLPCNNKREEECLNYNDTKSSLEEIVDNTIVFQDGAVAPVNEEIESVESPIPSDQPVATKTEEPPTNVDSQKSTHKPIWRILIDFFLIGAILLIASAIIYYKLIKNPNMGKIETIKKWTGRCRYVGLDACKDNNQTQEKEVQPIKQSGGNPREIKLSKKSTTEEILATFDAEFNTDRKAKYEELKKFAQNVKPIETTYKKLQECKTEEDLIKLLRGVNKNVTITSLSSVCKPADSPQTSIDQMIYNILYEIDNTPYGRNTAEKFKKKFAEVFKKRCYDSNEYNKAKKHLNLPSKEYLSVYLESAKNTFEQSDHTIADAVKVLKIFKLDDDKSLDTRQLEDIHKILDDLKRESATISQKDEYLYWDKLGVTLYSISKCLIPLLNIINKDNKLCKNEEVILQHIKSELIFAYVTKFYLRHIQRGGGTAKEFSDEAMASLEAAINKFNNNHQVLGEQMKLSSTLLNDGYKVVLERSILNMRHYEGFLVFADKMWDEFAEDFLKEAPNCNKAYILPQILNIAYHTADFLDHIKGGRDVEYCYNYAFLRNNFDVEATKCLEFDHNHYQNSTNYSNFIYEWVEEVGGLDKLKLLIENYLINS